MSNETPNREGLCVYCGTARPVSKPICPQCGRTWIDTKVGEDLPPLTPEIVAASTEEREALAAAQAELEPATRSRRSWGLLIGAVLGVGAIVLLLNAIFDGDGADTVAGSTSSVVPPTTAAAVTTTTAGTTTTPAAATTNAPTTTTTSTTTTSAPTTTVPPIEPEGTPVAIADLTLGAFALGPFPFDGSAPYLGRLVASLGQPDSMVTAGTDHGLCPDDTGNAYTWGALTAVLRTDGDTETLVGYRHNETGTDHPTQGITTRSGLELGHTVATLEAIYLQSGIVFEDIGDGPHYLLLRSTDEATLLWGPVSTTNQDGVVEGIFSPNACDGGPRSGS